MHNYLDLVENILDYGDIVETRGCNTKELLNQTLVISNKANAYYSDIIRPKEKILDYLKGEFAWYWSGDCNPDNIIKYSKFWDKLRDEKGNVNSNYGYIVFYKKHGMSQFNWCVENLKIDMYSRKAIIVYNDIEKMYLQNKDFICTQTQQFFIRRNVLSSTVYIRSSDAIRGLSFDIPFWSIVQQQVMYSLRKKYPELELGELTIYIGSAHLYSEHFDLAKKIVSQPLKQLNITSKYIIPLDMTFGQYEAIFDDMFEITEVI